MKVLVYRKCSTCMKALKWLDEHNINYEERAIKEENPTYEELKKWYAKSGLPLKKFFNTGGMIYKEMGLKDKLKDMSEDEQLKLLATDGMLVKRPLVIGDDFVLTGFREKESGGSYCSQTKKWCDRKRRAGMARTIHEICKQRAGYVEWLALFFFVLPIYAFAQMKYK